MHRVGIVVFDEVTLLDVSGPGEVLSQAIRHGLPYEVVLVSAAGGTVSTSCVAQLGGTLTVDAAGVLDTVIVAGAEHLTDGPIDPGLLEVVRRLAHDARRVAAVCTGAFVLAELGLLDGRTATTHWRHADALAVRYPGIRVDQDVIHASDGKYLTSAGITAGIDLALALVERDHGADAARAIARELVVYMNRPGGQAQYATGTTAARPTSRVLRRITERILADPAADHSIPVLAAGAHISERHLARLFRAELNATPARWVERVRLDRAGQLLLEGHTITFAAHHGGFGSDESLRRAFARHLGTTPTEYRRRFASTGAGNQRLGRHDSA